MPPQVHTFEQSLRGAGVLIMSVCVVNVSSSGDGVSLCLVAARNTILVAVIKTPHIKPTSPLTRIADNPCIVPLEGVLPMPLG